MEKPVVSDTPECGLEAALSVMGGRWKALILYHLRSGPKRFGDLKRLVSGISEKGLIHQLRELVAAQVLVRRDCQQVPPKVGYTVKPFGMTLIAALLPLCEWGLTHHDHVAVNGHLPPSPLLAPLP